MKTFQASQAKTQFLSLLDAVENGETVVITRHGKPIARLVPEESDQSRKRRASFEAITKLREQMPRLTLDEILSARHEGHKY